MLIPSFCDGLTHVPLSPHVEGLTPTVTGFRDKVHVEVITLNEVIMEGSDQNRLVSLY